MQDYVAMCPAKCEFAHEGCIGDMHREYNYVKLSTGV